jgi:hypothetical protein
VLTDASDFIDGLIDGPRQLSPYPCGASGLEISATTASPSASVATASARSALKVRVHSRGRSYTPAAAAAAGLVDISENSARTVTLVTSPRTPVTVTVSGRKVSLGTRALNGKKAGAKRLYTPVSGTVTVSGGKVASGKRVLAPSRDRKAPRTSVRVVRKAHGAVLRFTVRDASASVTMARVGAGRAKSVRGGKLRIARIPRRGVRVRYQSRDMLGNTERLRSKRVRP